MTKTRVIRVFSFIMALTLVFAMCSTPVYAMRPQQFGAWVAAAIQALNITIGSTLVPAADLGQKFSDFLNYPVRIEATQLVDVPYTFTDADIQDELNKSVIQIDKDSVTIDGVKYTDVWLSNDAAEKFRVNAFDIENAYDLTSHSEGTFVSGVGTAFGLPVFQTETNKYRTQSKIISVPTENGSENAMGFSFGTLNSTTWRENWGSGRSWINANVPGSSGSFVRIGNQQLSNGQKAIFGSNMNGDQNIYVGGYNSDGTRQGSIKSEAIIMEPFDFDWVSSEIPADEPLTSDEGLRIRVPTDAINQWYVDNPSFGPNVTINMGDPDLNAKIDDLIDLIIPLIPVLDIDFTTSDTPEPEPQPEPIPDPDPYPDPLPDPDISLIDSTLKDIIQALKNIFDNISIGNSISTAIKNLADQIKWVLDDILDKIGDLVDKIVRGNIDWFSNIIDAIKTPFLPWLNIFKLGVNIWHYVVTWVQNISAPFSYFWNILGNVSSIFYSPIYAVAAASIVIAIYRRFGR